jgi:hypothetical protein
MGWSEKYWEDVKSELELLASEFEPACEDETVDQPGTGRPIDAGERSTSHGPQTRED